MNDSRSIEAVDNLLPQTQCELCEYPGCKPYATAIINDNAPIDRCLPGGVDTLKSLGVLLGINTEHMLSTMQQKQKNESTVVIREDECIGCTKCIQACPVDAIIGSGKQMHTVIQNACTGCELCIPPCPVDCIDIIALPKRNKDETAALATQSRRRFEHHQNRLKTLAHYKKEKHESAKLSNTHNTLQARRNAIAEAIARSKAKKNRGDNNE